MAPKTKLSIVNAKLAVKKSKNNIVQNNNTNANSNTDISGNPLTKELENELDSKPKPKRISPKVKKVVQILNDKKVEDLVVLYVKKLVSYADYFIIGSGNSQTHVDAMASAVIEYLESRSKSKHVSVERDLGSTWVLIDGGNFILHIFQPETRKYYALEELWSDATILDIK